jgi:hypothetical protein
MQSCWCLQLFVKLNIDAQRLFISTNGQPTQIKLLQRNALVKLYGEKVRGIVLLQGGKQS